MKRLRFLLPATLVWICIFGAGLTFASEPRLATPEDAVAAYIDAVSRQDFQAIIATTSADEMSKKFDFVADIDRSLVLTPWTMSPASSPFFVELNKASFVARIAQQSRFLTYGLMSTSKVVEGLQDQMDAAGATAFATVVRADRLAGLRLVSVGIPLPKRFNSPAHQYNLAKNSKIYGADAGSERVALVSFEGIHFMIGFNLFRYGDQWTVFAQYSPLADLSSLGTPKRVTPDEFEAIIR